MQIANIFYPEFGAFNTCFFNSTQGSTNPIEVGFDVKTLTLVEVVHNVNVSMVEMGVQCWGFDGVVVQNVDVSMIQMGV